MRGMLGALQCWPQVNVAEAHALLHWQRAAIHKQTCFYRRRIQGGQSGMTYQA